MHRWLILFCGLIVLKKNTGVRFLRIGMFAVEQTWCWYTLQPASVMMCGLFLRLIMSFYVLVSRIITFFDLFFQVAG